MADTAPVFNQLNLVVADMEASLAFYRLLGVEIADTVPEWAAHHRNAVTNEDLALDFDSVEFAKKWNRGASGTTGGGGVIGFQVASRAAVDDLYARVTSAGYRGQQEPWDAFWGARYAIVEDPDGHPVGLMSPVDPAQRWDMDPPPS
jgi:catechol 2,3-dioxygenase-like lactoylglutathione lyase family enzyme